MTTTTGPAIAELAAFPDAQRGIDRLKAALRTAPALSSSPRAPWSTVDGERSRTAVRGIG